MKFPRVIIGCGLLLLAAASLYAQTAAIFDGEVQDIVHKTRFMIGPFRFYPLLKFSYFSWVSNIFGLTDPAHALSDLVITPSPELTAYLLYKRLLILSFDENPEYHFFLTQGGFRGFSNACRAEAKLLFFSRIIFSGRYEYTTQRSLGYLELARVVQGVSKGFAVQAMSTTARGTSFVLRASRHRLTFQDIITQGKQISPDLDRDELSAEAEVGYRIFSATSLFVRLSYTDYTFLEQTAKYRTSKSYDVQAGLRFPGNGVIRGSLTLGYRRFLPVIQGERGYSGPVGNAGVEFRMENLGIIEVNLSRDNSFSVWSSYPFFINNSVSARLTFRTLNWFFIRLGGQYGLLNYPGQPVLSASSSTTSLATVKDTYWSALGGGVVRLSPTFGIGVTYQKWLRNSPLMGQNFNGYLISIEIIRSF